MVISQPDPEHECGPSSNVNRPAVQHVGTPFSLNYRSDRVPGRSATNRLYIQLSGTTIPDSLVRIDLEIVVAGRKFFQQFPAAPNRYTLWDGRMLMADFRNNSRLMYAHMSTRLSISSSGIYGHSW
jgi:hypothetical protein